MGPKAETVFANEYIIEARSEKALSRPTQVIFIQFSTVDALVHFLLYREFAELRKKHLKVTAN